MINSWFKLRHIICPQHPKVGKMARALGCNRITAFGVACAWFRYVDMFTTDGKTHLTPEELDEELGFRGCANALSLVVWAALDADGCVVAPRFDEHCGETSKKRADGASRQQKSRVTKKCDTTDTTLSQNSVTPAAHTVTKKCDQNRKEKNREEQTIEEEKKRKEEDPPQRELDFSTPSSPSAPADEQEVYHFLANQPNTALPEKELRSCAQKFYLSGQACGWTFRNTPLKDWKASARLYLSRWQENTRTSQKTRSETSLNKNIYG